MLFSLTMSGLWDTNFPFTYSSLTPLKTVADCVETFKNGMKLPLERGIPAKVVPALVYPT